MGVNTKNGTAMIDAPRVEMIDEAWEFDFDRIKGKERAAFAQAWKDTQAKSDDSLILPWVARVLVRWPHKDLDPAKIDSYGELGLKQLVEVSRRFALAFRDLFATVETPATGGVSGS